MDKQFLNANINTIVFIVRCKYVKTVHKKNIQHSVQKYTLRSANLELSIWCLVPLWPGLT